MRSKQPYEVSKFELELLIGHIELQQRLQLDNSAKAGELPVRHILYDPGIVRTNIAVTALNNVVLEWLMQLAFLLVRLLCFARRRPVVNFDAGSPAWVPLTRDDTLQGSSFGRTPRSCRPSLYFPSFV